MMNIKKLYNNQGGECWATKRGNLRGLAITQQTDCPALYESKQPGVWTAGVIGLHPHKGTSVV